MEDYPSPAEGNGLENRQACKSVRGFESHILLNINAGWSSSVARRAHNPKVVGSSPTGGVIRHLKLYSLSFLYPKPKRSRTFVLDLLGFYLGRVAF